MSNCPECGHFLVIVAKDATGSVKVFCRYHRAWVWVRLDAPAKPHHVLGMVLEPKRKP